MLRVFAVFLLLVAAGCSSSEKLSSGQPLQPLDSVQGSGHGSMASVSKGALLAGSVNGSGYYDYDEAGFRAALESGKTVYLEFHAPWCSICRQQEPEIFAAFNSLQNPDVVGFRVDFDREDSLKRQYQIPYQHTRIILKEGIVVLRASDFWDRGRLLEALGS
ncbi:thioredoxin family protein [Candidatus Woesearchaeota archaeon]|nr:thioredoxin family protein [Candidatus Woesearchaeota archaeon]